MQEGHVIQAVKRQLINFLRGRNRAEIQAIPEKTSKENAERQNLLLEGWKREWFSQIFYSIYTRKYNLNSFTDNANMPAKQLVELFARPAAKEFKIDWFLISQVDLKKKHTMNECIGWV